MTAAPPPTPVQDHFTLDSNDRILAALGYPVWFVAVFVAVMEESKRKPLLKDHAVQAIGFTVASLAYHFVAGIIYVCASIITFGILAFFLWVIFFVPVVIGMYFGYLAYSQDGLVEIPYLTEYMTEQGWFQTRKAA